MSKAMQCTTGLLLSRTWLPCLASPVLKYHVFNHHSLPGIKYLLPLLSSCFSSVLTHQVMSVAASAATSTVAVQSALIPALLSFSPAALHCLQQATCAYQDFNCVAGGSSSQVLRLTAASVQQELHLQSQSSTRLQQQQVGCTNQSSKLHSSPCGNR